MKNQQATAPTVEPYLQVRQVSKSFAQVNVLRDISLDCARGELICLLGPSGCGKTTLLRIIAGLEQQDSGVLVQDGVDISQLAADKRDFGIVFQSYALFPNLSVEQNIGYGLRRMPKNQKRARVAELLKTIGLEEHAKKFPSQLSGGQQQRVALARALAISPGLLLLDEPLSALDAKVRVHLRQEIKALQRKLGITTIMVTHDQEEAMSMADRIVVINQGVIEQVGTPHEVYTHPATPFVGSFIGSMNFMTAESHETGVVEALDQRMNCEVPAWVSQGQQLAMAVRPEHISAIPVDSNSAQGIRGEIEKLEFMGAHMRLHMRVAGDKGALMADVQNTDYEQHQYAENMAVMIAMKESAIRLYANDRSIP